MGQFLTCRPEFADLCFKANIIKLYSEVKFITYIDIILMYNCNIEDQVGVNGPIQLGVFHILLEVMQY